MEGHDFFCEVDRSFIGKGATTVGEGVGGEGVALQHAGGCGP